METKYLDHNVPHGKTETQLHKGERRANKLQSCFNYIAEFPPEVAENLHYFDLQTAEILLQSHPLFLFR
jgi:hypothetical protein